MEKEEKVVNELIRKYPGLEGKCSIIRQRRITVEVERDKAAGVLGYLAGDGGFDLLCTITGLDSGENLEFIYHIANKEGIVMNLKIFAPKTDPVIQSVVGIYNGCIFYERELEDLLGAKVEGLPEGRHYPLPENWPKGQYPLRKEWTPENLKQNQ